jgi:hypothetical protein
MVDDAPNTPQTLGYVSGHARKSRVPVSGVLSLVAIGFQLPWVHICGLLAWAGFFGQDSRGLDGAKGTLVLGVPTIISLIYGIYSVAVAGARLRNIAGVLGVTLAVATIAAWFMFLN